MKPLPKDPLPARWLLSFEVELRPGELEHVVRELRVWLDKNFPHRPPGIRYGAAPEEPF